MEFASFSNLFGSKIGKTIRLVREIPLLMSATSDNEEATPGYVIEQVIALTFDSYKNVNDELVDWLNGRLRQNSLCVKLKLIKLYGQLVVKGSSKFKQVLRKHSSEITTTARLAGLTRNAQMAQMYASIRQYSKDILKELYRNEEDDDGAGSDRSSDKTKYKGFGNNWNKEGFGNTLPQTSSLISNIADKLAEISNPQKSRPYKEDAPASYGLTTSPTVELEETKLLFENIQRHNVEDIEKVLIQEYIQSTDVMINKRTRRIINECASLDRGKFIFCLRDHLSGPDDQVIAACLILIEALLRSNVYNARDMNTLFSDRLTNLYADHLDHKISFRAKKVVNRRM